MGSYYNRPWRGYFEVLDGPDWMRYNVELGSVEQGLALVTTNPIPGLKWRIVDAGGNVYESGQFTSHDLVAKSEDGTILYVDFKNAPIDPVIAARQEAFYSATFADAVRKQADGLRDLLDYATDVERGRPHISVSERRRLLEEALRG
jgi:hypothetical protein